MDVLHLAVLAFIQGVTEFLPVSSSGHLKLVPIFLGVSEHSLILDVAVHIGTLGAVIIYLWRDIWGIIKGIVTRIRGRSDPGARLAGLLIVGTVPLVFVGFFLNQFYPKGFRGLEVVGWATFGFGLLLLVADRVGMTLRRIEHLKVSDAALIGVAQVLALIPGTSRSGICMTAARMMGLERVDAARFAMLLGIPAILGAGALKGFELWKLGDANMTMDALLAAAFSLTTALISIHVMMIWLRRATFTIFAVYRILLGGFLLAVAYKVF